MSSAFGIVRSALLASTAAGTLVAVTGLAHAGGFAIREQSVESQGASFAGNAASPSLGAMFWNSAAATNKGPGLNTESNYSVIIPRATVDVATVTHPNPILSGLINTPAFGNSSGEIAGIAVVSASYASYQLSFVDPNLYLGLGMNAPFGLGTEPDNDTYKGAVLGRTSKLFTLNINPVLAYKVSPMLSIGVGLQAEYAFGKFKFATGLPAGVAPVGNNSYFEGNDWAFGATAGVTITPAPGTTIGLGWRSALTHDLDGEFGTVGATTLTPLAASAEIKLPDIVTLSLRQVVTPSMRLLGTVEWSNWSRFDELKLVAGADGRTILNIDPLGLLPPGTTTAGSTIATLPAAWVDGWFFSLGGEYDMNAQTTLRLGVAYEKSPIDDATKRLVGIPDANRVWLSAGLSYKWSAATTFDFAYTHLFVQDSSFDRSTIPSVRGAFREVGSIDAETDIISVGMKTKW
jgi:long-chain fatty acid transport protein